MLLQVSQRSYQQTFLCKLGQLSCVFHKYFFFQIMLQRVIQQTAKIIMVPVLQTFSIKFEILLYQLFLIYRRVALFEIIYYEKQTFNVISVRSKLENKTNSMKYCSLQLYILKPVSWQNEFITFVAESNQSVFNQRSSYIESPVISDRCVSCGTLSESQSASVTISSHIKSSRRDWITFRG